MADNICPVAEPSGSLYEVNTGDWKFEEPVIDPEECTGCSLCAVYCPTKTIHPASGHYRVDSDWCKGCGICIEVCPPDAIQMRRLSGKMDRPGRGDR